MSYLNLDQLDDDRRHPRASTAKEIFLDPGEKMCPFQTLHWKHSGAGGIRQSADGRGPGNCPRSPTPTTRSSAPATSPSTSTAASPAHFSFVMTGQEALHWRQTALENDRDEVKKQFDRSLESMVPDGVEAHVDHFLGLDNPDANLMAIVNVKGTLGTATSKRLLLPGFFFRDPRQPPFVNQEKRLEPVDMHYGEQVTDQVAYHLPAGCHRGRRAARRKDFLGRATLFYVTKAVSLPARSPLPASLARAFTFAKPEEYQDLRGFYQKVAAADQQQLVLTSSSRCERKLMMQLAPRSCRRSFCVAVAARLLPLLARPASRFGKESRARPQWGLDAAKTPTPAYANDAAAIILFDEYLETVDAQGRAVEREREAIRILKPQGRNDCGLRSLLRCR